MRNKETTKIVIFLAIIVGGGISLGYYWFPREPKAIQNTIIKVHSLSPAINKKDLVKLSRVIVIGTVKDAQFKNLPRNLNDSKENIVTDFQVSVVKLYKY